MDATTTERTPMYVEEYADAIREHGQAWIEYARNHDAGYAIETFEEAYQGHFDSKEDWAAELCEDIEMVPTDLHWLIAGHIDWEGVARDLLCTDYWASDRMDGGFYIYRNM